MLIFGLSSSLLPMGAPTAVCSFCGNPAAQRITQRRRRFSLFFIPVLPLGSSYVMDCTACGAQSKIDEAEAQRLIAHG